MRAPRESSGAESLPLTDAPDGVADAAPVSPAPTPADESPAPADAGPAPRPEEPAPGEEGSGGADEWLTQRERGQLWLTRSMFRLAALIGRRPMRPMVSLVALWYRLVDRKASGHSRDWLRRVHGREPTGREVYRHLRCFAQITLDKVFFMTGKTGGLEVTCNGRERIDAQLASGRGGVLLGSHLGSYDAMRAVGLEQAMRIQILGYFENARMINALIAQLNPKLAERVIHLGEDPVGVMARTKERLDDGEMVALMGDRVGLNERIVEAEFLGQPAPFAAGPFLLAALLRCPVYLVFGIYTEPDRYDLHCLPFAERIELPRKGRDEALQQWAQRYADAVAGFARSKPDNWFNFYDFWSRP